ncbi:MAG TPA: hypothetical protein VMT03_09855 [Polyangia bacterium]|nr:hypothetical protein [Polyangia bacterium]
MVRPNVVQLVSIAAVCLLGCSSGSGGGATGGTTGTGGGATGGQPGATGGTAGSGTGGAAGAAGGAGGGHGGDAGAAGGASGAAGGVGGAAGGAGGAAGAQACNSLINNAPVVNKDHDPAAPPAMTGGTLTPGLYYLTKMVQYNGENGNTAHQETWSFSASNTFDVVQLDGTRYSGTYAVSGTTVTLTITCPAAAAGRVVASPYTATATQLVTINSDDANEAHTFTLQSGTGGSGGAGGGAGSCTALTPSGSPVSEAAGTGTTPTPVGGTIATGTYQLTGWQVYSPATPDTTRSRKLAIRFGSTSFEVAGTDSNASPVNYTGAYTAAGTMLTTNWTCGPTGSVQQGYTASSTVLQIFNPRSGGVEVETWTLQ